MLGDEISKLQALVVMDALMKGALHCPPVAHFATGAGGYHGVVCWVGHFTLHMHPFILYLFLSYTTFERKGVETSMCPAASCDVCTVLFYFF
jgi:hypothetical protein